MFTRRLVAVLVALVALFGQLPAAAYAAPPEQAISRETLRDYAVLNGYYFTQTGGSPKADFGYSVTDEGSVPLWSEFQRLGGVDALGYPVSRRFVWDGFVVQAMQKVALQWRPDLGQAVFVNLLDEMTRAGKDDWLASSRLIPKPATFPQEAGFPFDQVIQDRLRLLDSYPALRAAYLTGPSPVETNGLPVAPVADVGPAYVLRAQRRAFQLWKVATPFANPGDVTVVNAGDLAKEADLLPKAALEPEPASSEISAPPSGTLRVSSEEVAALRQVVERARPAVVKLTDNESGLGSGILYDPSGLILTNSHVVTALNPAKLLAVLPDGRSLPAKPIGYDDWTDVAVVKVESTNLPWVPLGSSQSLTVGQRVVGIGYAPVFPGAPSAKAGAIRSLAGEIQTTHDYPLFNLISSDTYLHPGDSGGPLLNLAGQVVGINSAIQIARRNQNLTGFSIPVEGARQIADELISTGSVPRPHLGISVADVTPSLALQLGLNVNRGVLIREVTPDSPAAAARILSGDVIVAMDGNEVTSLDDLRRLMVRHKVGDVITLSMVTPGQSRRNTQLALAERPVVKLAIDSAAENSLAGL
ncbi:MAG: S1C family serine protease [Gaiellales bacterium]